MPDFQPAIDGHYYDGPPHPTPHHDARQFMSAPPYATHLQQPAPPANYAYHHLHRAFNHAPPQPTLAFHPDAPSLQYLPPAPYSDASYDHQRFAGQATYMAAPPPDGAQLFQHQPQHHLHHPQPAPPPLAHPQPAPPPPQLLQQRLPSIAAAVSMNPASSYSVSPYHSAAHSPQSGYLTPFDEPSTARVSPHPPPSNSLAQALAPLPLRQATEQGGEDESLLEGQISSFRRRTTRSSVAASVAEANPLPSNSHHLLNSPEHKAAVARNAAKLLSVHPYGCEDADGSDDEDADAEGEEEPVEDTNGDMAGRATKPEGGDDAANILLSLAGGSRKVGLRKGRRAKTKAIEALAPNQLSVDMAPTCEKRYRTRGRASSRGASPIRQTQDALIADGQTIDATQKRAPVTRRRSTLQQQQQLQSEQGEVDPSLPAPQPRQVGYKCTPLPSLSSYSLNPQGQAAITGDPKGKHRSSDSYTATTSETVPSTANGDDDDLSNWSVLTSATSASPHNGSVSGGNLPSSSMIPYHGGAGGAVYLPPPAAPRTPIGPPQSGSVGPYTSRRSFPPCIPIDPSFPRLYRNFPVPSAFGDREPIRQAGLHQGIAILQSPACGLFNSPAHGHLDLYTPRYVKGVGSEKVGACCICAEPKHRGGEGGTLWLKMKVSSYSYHLSFYHGINNVNGLPFSPPVEMRRTKRNKVAANEKTELKEGRCHECSRWIPMEGIKLQEVKVPELFWWKHAKACHKSRIAGEGHEHSRDEIFDLVASQAASQANAAPHQPAYYSASPTPFGSPYGAVPHPAYLSHPHYNAPSPAPTATSTASANGGGPSRVHPSVAAQRASAGRVYKRKMERSETSDRNTSTPQPSVVPSTSIANEQSVSTQNTWQQQEPVTAPVIQGDGEQQGLRNEYEMPIQLLRNSGSDQINAEPTPSLLNLTTDGFESNYPTNSGEGSRGPVRKARRSQGGRLEVSHFTEE